MLTTNQTNNLTFDRVFDFHMKFVGEKKTWVHWLDMVKKEDLTENKPKADNNQALISKEDGDS